MGPKVKAYEADQGNGGVYPWGHLFNVFPSQA